MKKLLKWLLGLIGFVVVLLVLAIILLPIFFDPNEHKPRIQALAADSIGREVVLNGPIEWSVFPWVAINLNDVIIANESGFQGDYLAQVEQVSVRVKLLPLIQKEIKVGLVELKQPKINLQVAASGRNNWQSILAASSAPENSASDSGADMEVRGISISEGSLEYQDGDLNVMMTDLSFESDVIRAAAMTAMSLSADVLMPTADLSGHLDTRWQAQNLTSGSGPQLDFETFSFDGKSGDVPLQLSASGNMLLDLSADTLKLNQLTLSYGAMKLSTSVNGNKLSSDGVFNGNLFIDKFSLADLLEQLGSPLNNQANNDFSGKLLWSLTGDRLQLSALQLSLDDSVITGSADIKQLSQLKGKFDLNVDHLNLDDYLPVDEANSTAETSGSSSMDLGQLNGQVKMNQFQAAGVSMSDVTLNVKTSGQDIYVEPLQAGFYQGLIKTELKLQPEKTTDKLTISHQMSDFQAGGLLTDLMGTDFLTGLGQLNADIKIDEPFSARPLQSAHGNIAYRLTDGDIVGVDVFNIMEQSLSLLNQSDAIKNADELKTAFGLMEIQASIEQGVLTTNTLRLTSPFFDLNGQVEINLDQQTIQGTIRPMLTNIPEGVLNKNFEKLLNLRIPVSLSGNLLEPTVRIDIEKLILESQKEKIDQKKEELKQDLLDSLLGNKKDKNKDANQQNSQEGTEPAPEMTAKQKKKAEKDQLKRDLLESLLGSGADKKSKKEQDEAAEKDGDGN